MPLRQIILALHFHKARNGPFKFKAAVAVHIQLLRRRIGRGDQLHFILVQRIDQRDEPRGFIAIFRAKPGNADDDHRMIMPRNGEII